MKLLLQHQANAIICDSDGNTALHRATIGGHVDIARLLVGHDSRLLAIHNCKNASPWDLVTLERRDDFKDMFVDAMSE